MIYLYIKTCDFHIYVSIPKSIKPNHHGILNTPDMVPHMWFYPLLFTMVSGIFNNKIYGIYIYTYLLQYGGLPENVFFLPDLRMD